ncbi:hypothetical protein [Gracilibacillus lacisalsi]|uniref:hypothetical protein n=1 Tax=Gracilibacillus lacisalsi TaxID=393087 RepID=UPI00037528BD|nr:hypothetical protein [Gracilibacillus lacisalsi]
MSHRIFMYAGMIAAEHGDTLKRMLYKTKETTFHSMNEKVVSFPWLTFNWNGEG